ncbi:MAG: hypothetical protein WCR54_04490 [Clostridia bacterium]
MIEKLNFEVQTKEEIITKYRIDEIISNKTILNNVSYSLQFIHHNLYLMENYAIPNSIKAMTCKQLLVNIFSVVEGIIFGAVATIQSKCFQVDCDVCDYYFNKDMSKHIDFDDLVKYLEKIKALDFSEYGEKMLHLLENVKEDIYIDKNAEIALENPEYNIDYLHQLLRMIKQMSIILADYFNKKGGIDTIFCIAKS